MRRTISGVFALLLALNLVACGGKQGAPTWQEQYDLGVRYLSEGNYQEAIVAFTAAIEIDPKRADAYLGLADVYVAMGDLEKAIQVLRDALDVVDDPSAIQRKLDELTAEPEPAPEPEEPKEWLKEHGIVITPQGDFTYTTMAHDTNNVDTRAFEIPVNVVVTESTDGVEEGYKEVKMVAVEDMSGSNNEGYTVWHSAFDRYTGTSFEFDTAMTTVNVGQSSNKEGFATIVNGDTSYDVSISFGAENEYPTWTNTVTVTCPVDYDGVVFQIGYNDSAKQEAFQPIDFAARLYTIDELPYYGDGYYYFSYSNE